MIYLDNQASTKPDPDVLNRMFRSYSNYANPHSNEHIAGLQAFKAADDSINRIALNLGCDSDEVIITSGATEANNIAIKSLCHGLRQQISHKNRILISSIEHKAVLEPAFALEFLGIKVELIPVSTDGLIDEDQFVQMLDNDVLLVSIMMTNNEIGVVQDIQKLAELAHQYEAYFHTDAAQAGYEPIDVYELDVDLLSLSGHKIYGPKGIGLLFISRDIHHVIFPLINGGGQQNNIRSGTLATPLVEGFDEALDKLCQNRADEKYNLLQLRNTFLEALTQSGIYYSINGDLQKRHPGNLNLCFDFDSSDFLTYSNKSFAISTGSACNGMDIDSSYVLKAIGLTKNYANRALRISFGRFNTNDDGLKLVECISNYVKNN